MLDVAELWGCDPGWLTWLYEIRLQVTDFGFIAALIPLASIISLIQSRAKKQGCIRK